MSGTVRFLHNVIMESPDDNAMMCPQSENPEAVIILKNNILDTGLGPPDGDRRSHNIYTCPQTRTNWFAPGEFVETDLNKIFVDPPNHDYRLRSNSPALNSGLDVGLSTDIVGTPRKQGSGFDIGAYEMPAL